MKLIVCALTAALVGLVVGCSGEEDTCCSLPSDTRVASAGVDTSRWFVEYRASDDSVSGTEAAATFWRDGPRAGRGSNVFLDLSDGDAVFSDSIALEPAAAQPPRPEVEAADYWRAVPSSEGARLFELRRRGGVAMVSIPAPVRLMVLPRALSVAAAGSITTPEEEPLSKTRVTWTKLPGSKVSVLARPVRARSGGLYLASRVDDAGELEIDLTKVPLTMGEYELDISRETRTPIGAPFGGGEAVSRFVDHVALVVTESPR